MARRSAEVPRAAGKVSALQVARIFSTRRRGGAEKTRDIGSSGDLEIVKATTACFTSRDLKRHACGSRSAPSPGVTDRYASMPGSVISTGAPRRFCSFKKSLARSGGIPREYPLQCRFREFSPDRQPHTLSALNTVAPSQITALPTAIFHQAVTETEHGANSLGQASPGTHSRDPSTPRPSFPRRRNPQRRFAQG
jgi:hypothetical protein